MNFLRSFLIFLFFYNYYTQSVSLRYLEMFILIYFLTEYLLVAKKLSLPTQIFIFVFGYINLSTIIANLFFGDIVFTFWRDYNQFYFYKGICVLGVSISSMFIATSFFKKQKHVIKPDIKIDYSFKKVNSILTYVAIPICLFSLLYGDLNLMIDQGYENFTNTRKAGDMSRLLILSLSYFLPWLTISSFILLIKGISNKYFLISIMLISLFISLISGDRTGLSIALVGMLISFNFFKNKKINYFKLGLLALATLLLFNVVKNARSVGYSNFSLEYLVSSNTDNTDPLQEIAFGMSNQFQSMPGTIMLLDEGIENYRFGLDLVRSALQSLPFGTTILKELGHNPRERKSGMFVQPTQWMSYHLNEREEMSGVGFLMLAEIFLNFGFIGAIFIPLLIVYNIENSYQNILTTNKKLKVSELFIKLVFFLQILIWIRNDSTSLIFTLFLVFSLFFIAKISKTKKTSLLNV